MPIIIRPTFMYAPVRILSRIISTARTCSVCATRFGLCSSRSLFGKQETQSLNTCWLSNIYKNTFKETVFYGRKIKHKKMSSEHAEKFAHKTGRGPVTSSAVFRKLDNYPHSNDSFWFKTWLIHTRATMKSFFCASTKWIWNFQSAKKKIGSKFFAHVNFWSAGVHPSCHRVNAGYTLKKLPAGPHRGKQLFALIFTLTNNLELPLRVLWRKPEYP